LLLNKCQSGNGPRKQFAILEDVECAVRFLVDFNIHNYSMHRRGPSLPERRGESRPHRCGWLTQEGDDISLTARSAPWCTWIGTCTTPLDTCNTPAYVYCASGGAATPPLGTSRQPNGRAVPPSALPLWTTHSESARLLLLLNERLGRPRSESPRRRLSTVPPHVSPSCQHHSAPDDDVHIAPESA